MLLNDCMQAVVNYFTDQEWCSSCENIAKFVARRLFLLLIVFAIICCQWYINFFLSVILPLTCWPIIDHTQVAA